MPPSNPNPHRGVSWHKKQKRWRVKLKQRVYGAPPLEFYMEFPDEPGAAEIAARVYDAAARMVFGKCCTLNFPGEALPDEVDPERIRRKLLDAGWPAASLRSSRRSGKIGKSRELKQHGNARTQCHDQSPQSLSAAPPGSFC